MNSTYLANVSNPVQYTKHKIPKDSNFRRQPHQKKQVSHFLSVKYIKQSQTSFGGLYLSLTMWRLWNMRRIAKSMTTNTSLPSETYFSVSKGVKYTETQESWWHTQHIPRTKMLRFCAQTTGYAEEKKLVWYLWQKINVFTVRCEFNIYILSRRTSWFKILCFSTHEG